jgi:hypothetical protein
MSGFVKAESGLVVNKVQNKYIAFTMQYRKKHKDDPRFALVSVCEQARIMGRAWQNLSDDQKARYGKRSACGQKGKTCPQPSGDGEDDLLALLVNSIKSSKGDKAAAMKSFTACCRLTLTKIQLKRVSDLFVVIHDVVHCKKRRDDSCDESSDCTTDSCDSSDYSDGSDSDCYESRRKRSNCNSRSRKEDLTRYNGR